MSTKDYRGREIIVSIAGDEKQPAKKKGRGAIPPPRRKEKPLKRRTGPSGIKFYDIGFVNEGGVWVGLDHAIAPPVTGVTSGGLTVRSPILSDWSAIASQFFAVATENWRTKFRKITPGPSSSVLYQMVASFGAEGDYLDNLEQWTANGLVVSAADLSATGLAIGASPLFFPSSGLLFSSDPDPAIRITGTPDFAGPEVPFVPSTTMEIFIAPNLNLSEGHTNEIDALGQINNNSFLNHIFFVIPREWILDPTDAAFGHDIFGGSVTPVLGVPPTAADYEPVYRSTLAQKRIPGTRTFFIDPFNVVSTGDFPTINAMPVPPSVPTFATPGFAEFTATVSDINPLSGVFLAAVLKGSTPYYFWVA